MEFKTEAQKKCYEKILPWVKEAFGQFAQAHSEVPVMGVVLGSTAAQVGVYPWGSDDASITTRAWVVRGADIVPDLMEFLLHENDKMRFGAFGLDKDNNIFFEHTIVGSTCDREELRASVTAVVSTADRYDDPIAERWGGTKALDHARQMFT